MNAVCFDLDGTLLHFSRDYVDVLAETFVDVTGDSRESWIETYNEEFFQRFRSHQSDPVEGAFAETLSEYDAGELAQSLLRHEIEKLEPAPGIEALLDELTTQKVELGVVTNGVPEWQRAKLEAVDLLHHFDAVIASYEAGAHKPDPAPFRLAEDRLGAGQYIMIGDSSADIDGAAEAGWDSIRYDGTGFTEFDLSTVLR